MNIQIVIPEQANVNEAFTAYRLKDALAENGMTAGVVTLVETAGNGGIWIGRACGSATVTGHCYAVTAKDGQIRLVADSSYGYEAALDALLGAMPKAGMPDGLELRGDAAVGFTDSQVYMQSKAGDLRAMFYNIYGWGGAGPTELRQQEQLELMRWYKPDVLGMQEYSASYHSGFTAPLCALGYAKVEVENDQTSYTPLFYRTDTMELLDCGSVLFPETFTVDGVTLPSNDVRSKSLTWAVLRLRKTGKAVIAASTHFMWDDPARLKWEQANAIRIANAQMALDTIRAVRAKNAAYRTLPCLLGGDLNSCPGSGPFQLLQQSGMVWAYDAAEVKSDCGGTKPYPVYDAEKKYYTANLAKPAGTCMNDIDFIWIGQGEESAPGVRVSVYGTVTDRYACQSSDHCPKFVDVTLN